MWDLETKSRDGCTELHAEIGEGRGTRRFITEPPESKTLRLIGVVLLVWEMEKMSSEGRHRLPYIGRRTRVSKVGGSRVPTGYNKESYPYELQ
jgi:hypothetical protein